jgi:hypothetical protein
LENDAVAAVQEEDPEEKEDQEEFLQRRREKKRRREAETIALNKSAAEAKVAAEAKPKATAAGAATVVKVGDPPTTVSNRSQWQVPGSSQKDTQLINDGELRRCDTV